MTPAAIIARAERFAGNLNLLTFVTIDSAARELYGTCDPVLNERKLRNVYERNEPNSAWRDFPAFRDTMQRRLDFYVSNVF